MAVSKKPRYNLNLIVQETGLKPDTIRAWERRYKLPLPARSEGGHRLYSDYNLATLKWLVAKQKEGMRISQAVNYWMDLVNSDIDPLLEDKDQSRQVDTLVLIDENNDTLENLQQNWLEYCLDFDESHAEQILSLAFAQFPIETVLTAVILPSLNQVGQLWYQDEATVQQEHFISEIIINKIETLISAAPNPVHTQRILVACPPDEQHTIVNMIMTLLLKHRGWEVIYLGANVPLDKFSGVIKDIRPDLVIMNASRLLTAATLLRSLNLLQTNKIAAAFGGWIFSQIPGLAEVLPGTYLGNDLQKSIMLIEDLITGHLPSGLKDPRPLQHQELVEKLNTIRPELDSIVRANLSTAQTSFITQDIYQTNQTLIQDISAALSLGNINYLTFNVDWLSGLLTTRKFGSDQLILYLRSFSAAVEDLVGPQASMIVSWIETSTKNNHKGD